MKNIFQLKIILELLLFVVDRWYSYKEKNQEIEDSEETLFCLLISSNILVQLGEVWEYSE